jgi:aspartyl-tRNA(Asn)/glutamyl-tRNA(Gln) amidotransferase subunit B
VEANGKTVSQRSKEYAHDYRYFPEPDLPPLVIGRDWVEAVGAKLPELPEARRDRFMAQYALSLYDASLLTSSKAMADYFEDCQRVNKEVSPKEISNWLLGEASRIMNTNSIDISEFRKTVSPEGLSRLILSARRAINTATAKTVLEEMFKTGRSDAEIIAERGLSQISDTRQLEETILEVINSNVQPVADYRAGKEAALKFLVGQVMKATRGRANPQIVNEMLRQKLNEVLNRAGEG